MHKHTCIFRVQFAFEASLLGSRKWHFSRRAFVFEYFFSPSLALVKTRGQPLCCLVALFTGFLEKRAAQSQKQKNGLPFVGYSEHYYCISILASLQTCFRVFALFLYFTVFHFHLLVLLTLNLNFDIKKIQFNACKLNETNTCSCARVFLQTISEQSRLWAALLIKSYDLYARVLRIALLSFLAFNCRCLFFIERKLFVDITPE